MNPLASWQAWALMSAGFAALTAIFATAAGAMIGAGAVLVAVPDIGERGLV